MEYEEKIRSLGGIDADSKTCALYEEVLFDLRVRRRKRLIDLTMDDINMDRCAQALISDADSLRRCAAGVHDPLSVRGRCSFLHTEPHLDIILE